MICLLGEPEDTDLLWLAVGVRERGQRVEVVLPDELVLDSALAYRVGSASTSWGLTLGDGRAFGPRDVSLVVNRLTTLPAGAGQKTTKDAWFVAEEWRAAVAGWLRAMDCPVLNPPRATALTGPLLSTPEWRAVAHAFGVPARPYSSDEPSDLMRPVTMFCVGRRCVDPAGAGDAELHAQLPAMAAHVNAPLLGVFLERVGDALLFCDATVRPELRAGGTALLDAVLDVAGLGRADQ